VVVNVNGSTRSVIRFQTFQLHVSALTKANSAACHPRPRDYSVRRLDTDTCKTLKQTK
jgi:hypothetical protein